MCDIPCVAAVPEGRSGSAKRAASERRGWDCTGSHRRELGTAECLGLIDEFERLRVTAVPVRTESSV